MRCGGPNAPSKCVSTNVATECTPKTCEELGVECGQAGDGCGNIIQCATCPSGQQCGGVGAPSKCVSATATGPDGGACIAKTKAEYNAEGKDCGKQSNLCGGEVDLGTCKAPAFCGGGGPSKCGIAGGGDCIPKTCKDFPGTCGPQNDGCGDVTRTAGGAVENCGTCNAPQICGGGGKPGVCGGGGGGPDGGACQKITTCGPSQCGFIADGCGGTLDCGTSRCKAGEVCGGAGTPNLCAPPPCDPIDFCPLGMNCGSIANGCGGLVQCGPADACKNGSICGGGSKTGGFGCGVVVADGGGPCNPVTACQPNQCGPIPDGCGKIINCPACTGGAICGGGGAPSVCAGGTCKARTQADCATLGFNCGFIADGCGGPAVQCGATCPNGGICGLTSPNVCSTSSATCTGLCPDQPKDCSGPNTANTTTIKGVVYMPNGRLPVYDALVYVPNGNVGAVPEGVGTCDSCSAPASGDPLVSTKTNYKGEFTLTNMPHRAGGVPVVIQSGRWRKIITVNTTRCGTVNLSSAFPQAPTTNNTTFGDKQTATNNIPKFAVTTGGADALQCLMRKVGIADSEFTHPQGNGRVNLYAGSGGTSRYRSSPSFNGYSGTSAWSETNPTTRSLPNQTYLFGNSAAATVDTSKLDDYDAVLLTCEGAGDLTSTYAGYRAEMKAYADRGGRVFASHWHHSWLEYGPNTGPAPWGTPAAPAVPVATFNHRSDPSNPINATINRDFPKGEALAQWLVYSNTINGTTASALGTVSIREAQRTVATVDTTRATSWITIPNAVQYFDFNTPLNAATQCGRFVNSDVHVSAGDSSTDSFPSGCQATTSMTDQEKILMFMLFDLTSCIQQPEPPKCTKRTCADFPAGTCGQQSDGCGGLTTNCGVCVAPQTCGGGGTPSRCGTDSSCTPKTCQAGQCGEIPNGCGQLLNCGTCTTGTCGGAGTPNQCGTPTCTAKTCAQLGVGCGQTGNGCGGVLTCPSCPAGQTCGGGGIPNQCGGPSCEKLTKCPAGKNCGTMPDGCGGVINCGTCPGGQSCGGGGSPNTCGAASCSPKTCEQQGAQCGVVSNQCGGVDTCDDCPTGLTCTAQNTCVGSSCVAKTCEQLGVECGPVGDGCGKLLQCGSCPAGQACGAGGVPGKCGTNPCTPLTCAQLDAQCGRVANGCGGLTENCGSCPGSTSCSHGTCVQACTPTTCAAADANCGIIADGCGGTVDCGSCPDGQTCGFEGRANVCGSNGPK